MRQDPVRGAWVEVERVVLRPEERAPQIPAETRAVPYVLRVSGFLDQEGARLGEEVGVLTLAGRRLRGRLVAVNPSYRHGFGDTVEALLRIGAEGEPS
jgi:hypothetical protein